MEKLNNMDNMIIEYKNGVNNTNLVSKMMAHNSDIIEQLLHFKHELTNYEDFEKLYNHDDKKFTELTKKVFGFMIQELLIKLNKQVYKGPLEKLYNDKIKSIKNNGRNIR